MHNYVRQILRIANSYCILPCRFGVRVEVALASANSLVSPSEVAMLAGATRTLGAAEGGLVLPSGSAYGQRSRAAFMGK